MANVIIDYVEVDALEPFREVVIYVSDVLSEDLDNYLISRNTGLPVVDRPTLEFLTSREEVP